MIENLVPVPARPRTRIAASEAEQKARELVREVRELFEQYRREVPKKRRPWPESIKKRILALWALGLSSHQIGFEAGIPVQTLYSWRQRIRKEQKSGFAAIELVREPRRTKFQIREDEDRKSSTYPVNAE